MKTQKEMQEEQIRTFLDDILQLGSREEVFFGRKLFNFAGFKDRMMVFIHESGCTRLIHPLEIARDAYEPVFDGLQLGSEITVQGQTYKLLGSFLNKNPEFYAVSHNRIVAFTADEVCVALYNSATPMFRWRLTKSLKDAHVIEINFDPMEVHVGKYSLKYVADNKAVFRSHRYTLTMDMVEFCRFLDCQYPVSGGMSRAEAYEMYESSKKAGYPKIKRSDRKSNLEWQAKTKYDCIHRGFIDSTIAGFVCPSFGDTLQALEDAERKEKRRLYSHYLTSSRHNKAGIDPQLEYLLYLEDHMGS